MLSLFSGVFDDENLRLHVVSRTVRNVESTAARPKTGEGYVVTGLGGGRITWG
jgi:hypothetical protein